MEILMVICLITGTFFTLMAALGLLKMPDIYMRIHAATKAGTFGIGMIVFAVFLFFMDTPVTSRVVGIMLFLIMTTPAAAHLLGKIIMTSSYRMWRNSGHKRD
ncbi:MAG: monovalent cation/H(+) antiporter subunit G [Desulfobacterales bacterium]|nr:monovalent cation/H(+) antiporter subunit G [Desulfobacterales bacterium]